jgi:hypothetical protein
VTSHTLSRSPLLLQVRTRVLNDDLAGVFQRWYPAFRHWAEGQELAA